MSIRFNCECGQVLKASDDMVGKRARCAACKKIMVVPPPAGQPGSGGSPPTAGLDAPAPPPGSMPPPPSGAHVAYCPHCRAEMDVPGELLGHNVRCPTCGAEFEAPTDQASVPVKTPAYAPPTASYPPPVKGASPYGPYPPQAPYQTYRPVVNAPGAVSALVCGILGLVLCPIIFSIIAIVQGKKAKAAAMSYPAMYKGAGMAQAGFVMGIIGLGWFVIVIMINLARMV